MGEAWVPITYKYKHLLTGKTPGKTRCFPASERKRGHDLGSVLPISAARPCPGPSSFGLAIFVGSLEGKGGWVVMGVNML